MIDIFNNENASMLTDLKIPSTYYEKKSLVYQYWFRSLLHKIDSSLVFKNLPEGWSNDFFMFCLWALGFVGVFKTNRSDLKAYGENGIVFQPCTISKPDFYYQPSEAYICNPFYQNTKPLIIHKDIEILKLTPDFRGVFDILDFYAGKLSEICKGIDMGLLNAKTPMILSASNEAQALSLKKIYDKVQAGESLIVWDDEMFNSDEIMPRKEPFEAWTNNFKDTYIVTSLLTDMQTILNSFYTEIGLPVSLEKKERLVTSEADFSIAQSQARIACWYETIQESLEIINKKYNLNIEVEYARTNDIDGDRDGIEP